MGATAVVALADVADVGSKACGNLVEIVGAAPAEALKNLNFLVDKVLAMRK